MVLRLDEAAQTEGLPMEYYMSYDATFKQPWKYFDNITAIDKSKLSKCTDTSLGVSARMQLYLDMTGDAGGVEMNGTEVRYGKRWV